MVLAAKVTRYPKECLADKDKDYLERHLIPSDPEFVEAGEIRGFH